MKLFDDIERVNLEPAGYAEPEFTFLNLSGREAVKRIRQLLESWFSRYPISEQDNLRTRFRSDIDSQHRAAFFELFLHELLIRLGCEISIHPILDDGTKRPDYRLGSTKGDNFYMEATIATGESIEEAGARARMNAVYDGVNALLQSPDFFIGMELKGTPKTQPSFKEMAIFLKEHIVGLNYDEIVAVAEFGDFNSLPRWHYQHEEWGIDFFPIPKRGSARGRSGIRPIGMQLLGFQGVDNRTPLRDAIVRKAGRYGNLDLPYVIAVNALDYVDEIDIMEALFGKEQVTVTFSESEPNQPVQTEMTRLPDGVWTSKSGPRFTRVSAILLVTRLSPWSIASANIRLYHNPWAQRRYSSELTRLSQAIPQNQQMMKMNGESLATIFELPLGWPEV